MKNGAPETSSLPLGPARRAAVTAALHAAGLNDEYLRRLAGAHGAVLVDDLCRLGAWCDALEISDAALACAAAEAGLDVSRVARIVFVARLHLRAAGLRPKPTQHHREAVQIIHCADLITAFDTLVEAGTTVAHAPRRLLDGLRGGGAAQTTSVVGALLAAAYSDDRADLVAALCLAPYHIDPGNLGAALSSIAATTGRTALTAAVGELRGAQAREAALSAVSALDAARPDLESSDVSLAAAVGALEQAVSGYAESSEAQLRDPQFSELLRSAASADRLWAAGPPEFPPALRVRSLLESVGQVDVARGLALVPDGRADEPCQSAIRLADAPGTPILWGTFAHVLEVAAEKTAVPEDVAVQIVVGAPLARAAADYVFASAHAIAHRAWPQAEAALTFTAPRMTFSASRLNAYVKCPRRWFYDYMCEVLEDPPSLHAAYGRVVHDALESLHRQVRMPNRHEASFMLDRLLRELDVAFGKARPDFDSQLEYEVSRCRARRMAEQYVRWLTLEAARAPMEIIHVELLQRQRFGGHDFVGYIDRIDQPVGGGPVTIYDYKTGRIDSDPREYLEKVRHGDEAQLALYYAMRRADGDEVARIALVSIRDPRDDAWILALDITGDDGKAVIEREAHEGVLRASSSRADLDTALAALIARCDFLTKQGLSHFPVGEDPPCNFCAYARACRERPKDGERIFAR